MRAIIYTSVSLQKGKYTKNIVDTCGITSSQVFTDTVENPVAIALLTSSWTPYLNHRVNSRSVSCKESTFRRDIDRKKPRPFDWKMSTHLISRRTFNGLDNMTSNTCNRFIGARIPLTFHIADKVKVGQSPSMPCFVPS